MKAYYLLIYILFCTAAFAQTETVVNTIRKTVEQINKDKTLTQKTLNNEQFLQHNTDAGGQLTGYFKNGQLVKIVERIGLSSCIDITEYYIQNNALIFVYAQGKEFEYVDSSAAFNSSIQKTTMECRFYYQNNNLIKSAITGATRCGGGPAVSWSQTYLDNYVRYAKLLTIK